MRLNSTEATLRARAAHTAHALHGSQHMTSAARRAHHATRHGRPPNPTFEVRLISTA